MTNIIFNSNPTNAYIQLVSSKTPTPIPTPTTIKINRNFSINGSVKFKRLDYLQANTDGWIPVPDNNIIPYADTYFNVTWEPTVNGSVCGEVRLAVNGIDKSTLNDRTQCLSKTSDYATTFFDVHSPTSVFNVLITINGTTISTKTPTPTSTPTKTPTPTSTPTKTPTPTTTTTPAPTTSTVQKSVNIIGNVKLSEIAYWQPATQEWLPLPSTNKIPYGSTYFAISWSPVAAQYTCCTVSLKVNGTSPNLINDAYHCGNDPNAKNTTFYSISPASSNYNLEITLDGSSASTPTKTPTPTGTKTPTPTTTKTPTPTNTNVILHYNVNKSGSFDLIDVQFMYGNMSLYLIKYNGDTIVNSNIKLNIRTVCKSSTPILLTVSVTNNGTPLTVIGGGKMTFTYYDQHMNFQTEPISNVSSLNLVINLNAVPTTLPPKTPTPVPTWTPTPSITPPKTPTPTPTATPIPSNTPVPSSKLTSFRNACMSGDNVVCSYSTLLTYLQNKTVADLWWEFRQNERFNIAQVAIKNILDYQFQYCSDGNANCAGSDGKWYTAICPANAAVRVILFGKVKPTNADKCYWKHHYDSQSYCFLPSHQYGLPTYVFEAYASPGVGTKDYGHAMACIQIHQDGSKLTSYVVFQYNDSNIRGGSFQLPTHETPIDINLIEITSVTKSMYSGTTVRSWKKVTAF